MVNDPAAVTETVETVDGVRPLVAVYPETGEEVASILSFAAEERLAVTPRGGGTALHLGNRPQRADILLHTTSIRGELVHSPEDMVATVPSGLSVQEVNAQLAQYGQSLPLDPPMPEKATIGGVLASRTMGPRTQGFGRPRDSVLGMKVALPDGSMIRAGGKVVKNVAGYDLTKLYTGSLGTLGVILEATFKLRPLPEATASLALPFPTLDGAVRTSGDLLRSGLKPLAFAVLSAGSADALELGSHAYYLLVEFGDQEEVVERGLSQTRGMAEMRGAGGGLLSQGEESDDIWAAVASLPVKDWEICFQGFVPLATMEALLDGVQSALAAVAPEPGIVAHPGFGMVHMSPLRSLGNDTAAQLFEELVVLCSSLGGQLLLERAPPGLKSEVDVWGPQPPAFDLMSRLKAQFDPLRTLNPGRFLGGL